MDIELNSFFLPLPPRRRLLLLLLLLLLHYLFLRPSSIHASSDNKDDVRIHLRPSKGLVITVLVSLGFLLIAFLILYFQNCRHGNLDGGFSLPGLRREHRQKPGLDRAVIDSFPTLVYSEVRQLNHNDDYHVECAVCLGEFGDREKLRLLPGCKHAFHLDCIDMWLDSHTTCPVCRAQLDAVFPETAGTAAPTAEMDLSRTWTERERERFSLRADPQVLIRCSSMGRDEGGSGRVHEMARWVGNAMSERWISLARMAPLQGLTPAGEGTSGGQSRTGTAASIV